MVLPVPRFPNPLQVMRWQCSWTQTFPIDSRKDKVSMESRVGIKTNIFSATNLVSTGTLERLILTTKHKVWA